MAPGNVNKAAWARRYRERMNALQEHCRHCGAVWPLTFGHLIPRAKGGTFTLDNITILCIACNQIQGTEVWPELKPLLSELPRNQRPVRHNRGPWRRSRR